MANTTQQKGGNQNQSTLDKAKDMAATAGEKVKDAASTVGDMAGHAAASVGHAADRLATNAGSGMRSLGETIEKKGPQDGMLGSATKAVAGTLASGGKYIEEQGFSGMLDDLGGLIKRNPIPAILIGVGVGVLISRALRS